MSLDPILNAAAAATKKAVCYDGSLLKLFNFLDYETRSEEVLLKKLEILNTINLGEILVKNTGFSLFGDDNIPLTQVSLVFGDGLTDLFSCSVGRTRVSPKV